ncbi:hypothetical protein [Burkholderia ubonensis]|uniref:hypothetical protein n=1 Tax=Burkholderia ubonensis TaxID=101571 RepID=UPI000F56E774|nr:hypothetical protein [Burkholderia ubonensis]
MQLVFLLFQLRLLAAAGDRRHCVDISARLAGAAQAAENEMIPAAYFRIGNETDIERNRSESPRIIRIFRNNPESGLCRFGNTPTRRTRRANAPCLALRSTGIQSNSARHAAPPVCALMRMQYAGGII